MRQERSSAFSGRQVGTVLAALLALAVIPVGAHGAPTTLVVHARLAPRKQVSQLRRRRRREVSRVPPSDGRSTDQSFANLQSTKSEGGGD